MPPVNPNNNQYLFQLIAGLQAQIRALTNAPQQFVIDPTTVSQANPAGNAVVIIGNLTMDNQGNATGLSGYGIASLHGSTWTQL